MQRIPPRSLFRNVTACLFVYDITNRNSFEQLTEWINYTENEIDENAILVLVAAKSDLKDDREVSFDEGQQFASEYNMLYFETSAKEDLNISEMFDSMLNGLKERAEEGKISKKLRRSIVLRHIPQNGTCNL